jgi:Na+/melibiose symporter-like transporter
VVNVIFVTGMVVNGFVNVVITTIERRFGLRSSQSGLVAGGYDIASFLCLIPVTYLGGRPGASKPRWLGWGILVMGIGSLVFTLPHFAVGPYRGATHHASTCNVVTNISTETVLLIKRYLILFKLLLIYLFTFSVKYLLSFLSIYYVIKI